MTIKEEFRAFLNEGKYNIIKTEQIGKYAIVAFIEPKFKSCHIAVFIGKETEEPNSNRTNFSMTGNIPEKHIENSFEKVTMNVKAGKEPHISTDI